MMTVDKDGSDADVLDSMFSSGRDRGADSAAPEAPEPKAQPDPKPEAEAPKAEATDEEKVGDSPKQVRDPETGRFVPLTELRSERTKRQAEAQAHEETKRELAAMRERFEAFERQQQQLLRQQPQQPQPEPPSWDLDPATAAAQMQQQFVADMYRTRVALGERLMRKEHADFDDVSKVFATEAQRNPALLQAVLSHPDPAGFAYTEGQKLKLTMEVGSDPDGFRERIRKEEREKVLAELKAKPAAAPPQRLPGTLADATAAGGDQGAILTDDAMLGSIFKSDRRRR